MKQSIIRLVNLLLIAGILVGYQQYAIQREVIVLAHEKEEKEAKALEKRYQSMVDHAEGTASQNKYKDGIYEGIGQGYGGDIQLKITVKQGEISSIDLVSAEGEDSLYLNLAINLFNQIVEKQSADIDGISGATYSSKGILEAAKQALKEAVADE